MEFGVDTTEIEPPKVFNKIGVPKQELHPSFGRFTDTVAAIVAN